MKPPPQTNTAALRRATELLFGRWQGTLIIDRGDIERAHRKKVFENHPDRAVVLGRSADELTRAFQAVQRARSELLQTFEELQTHALRLSVPIRRLPQRSHSSPRPSPRPAPPAPPRTRPPTPPPQPASRWSAPREQRPNPRRGALPSTDPLRCLLLYGELSLIQVVEARAWLRGQRPRVGSLARDWGMLSEDEILELLRVQRWETHQRRERQRFCDLAVNVGKLTPMQRMALLGRQRRLPQPGGSLRAYLLARRLLRPDQLDSLALDLENPDLRAGRSVA